MEQRVLNLLEIIEKKEDATQRDLARYTGMSLGMVNILIKRCVKKGLLKVERLNSRSLKYILTPEGIKEKSQKTLAYIKRSYRTIIKITDYIREITKKQLEQGYTIWVLGNKDEIFQLVINTLNEMQVEYRVVHSLNNLEPQSTEKIVVYYWEPELVENMDMQNNSAIRYIDIVAV